MGLFDFLKKKPGDQAPAPAASAANDAARPGSPGSLPDAAAQQGKAQPQPVQPESAQPQPAQPASAQPSEAAQFVDAVDGFGRRMRIPRAEYRTKYLPELLKSNGGDAERLVAVILQALRDGFAADVLPAANRLTVVDKDVERALSVLAVVQRDAGEVESAAKTLDELQQKRPGSAAARVGRGMLAVHRGDHAAAEALLWEALQLDPNHADAVHGWLQLRHRAVGEGSYRAEVEKAAALPNAWRARLWLARLHLQQQRTDDAAAVYREVLGSAGNESDALVMASGDLVQTHQHALVKELIAPRFRAGRHHPHVGLALLHHYLQTQDHAAGSALLHQMFLHYGHMIGNDLQPFTAEFDRMRVSKLAPPPAPSGTPRVGLYRLDRPIWYAGLEDPTWLLPRKQGNAKTLLFFALAVDGQPSLPPGREDELGRLTRSLPLFLAEQAWLATPHRGTAVLPMAEQGGWAIMGRPWPEEQLLTQVPENERADTLLVTGVLRVDGEQRRIDLWVYDCGTKQRIGHAATEGSMQEAGRMLLQLMRELWPVLGGPADHKPPVGDDAFWQRHADGLGQHAALVVTQAGGMPKDRLFGERYITQWLQANALAEPRWQPGFWLLASALCVLHQLGSEIPKEHARAVAELFRQSPPDSAFARLGARTLRAVGLDAIWQARRPEIVAATQNDATYASWLRQAEAGK